MGGRPGSSTDGPSAQGGWPLNSILPGMDVHPAGSLGSRHHPERLQTRVHFIPSNYPHSKTHTVPSRLGGEGQGALGRGEGTSRQGGDHSYRASLLTRILGNILSSSEEIRGVATDTKSETSQCIHQTETFSNGHAGLHSQVSSQEQMGRVLGPKGCLPPRTDSSFGLQVAEVPDSGSILQLDLPSIRSFYISKSIHHGSQGDCILPPAERSQCVHVPRRLANLRGFSSRSIPPLSVSNRDCSTSRIHHQLREISLDSYPGHSLPGSQDPLRPRTSNTFSRPHQSSQVSGQLLPPQNPINSSGVAEVISLMASMVDIVPYCRLHMRLIQLHFAKFYQPSVHLLSRMVPVSPEVKHHLSWWTREANLTCGVRFPAPQVELVLTTDASKTGWGGHLLDHRTAGLWNDLETKFHINVLELLAVERSLHSFQKLVKGKVILVQSDNSTTVAYINKQGGTHSHSLCIHTIRLINWCRERAISLTAIHIPGVINILADDLSRGKTSNTEWILNHNIVHQLFHRWFQPSIDLFASAASHQLPVYCSRSLDPMAYATDALTLDWSGMRAYAFPPFQSSFESYPRFRSRTASSF